MAGVFSASLAVPRWIKAAAVTRIEAMRRLAAKRGSERQLNMAKLNDELASEYEMKAKLGTIELEAEKLPARFQNEKIYPGFKYATPEGDFIEMTRIKTLVFPDGYRIADANGNGGLDAADFNMYQGIEDILNRIKLTQESVLNSVPEISQDAFKLKLNKVSEGIRSSLNHADNQQYYPIEQVAELFASAWILAESKSGMTQQELSGHLDSYISTLRFESRQRLKLEELEFFANDERSIELAAVQQAEIISSIQDVRENKVIPMIAEIAEFIGQ
jgi:hypothetical protein